MHWTVFLLKLFDGAGYVGGCGGVVYGLCAKACMRDVYGVFGCMYGCACA